MTPHRCRLWLRGRPRRGCASRLSGRNGGHDVIQQIGRPLVSILDLGSHSAHDDVADRPGDGLILQARRRDEFAGHEFVEIGRRGSVVRQHPGQHLIHRHAQRIDVGREHGLSVKLLRRHVGRTADDRRPVRSNFEKTRGPEVCDLQHVVLGDQHVGGPQVAVNDALCVRVIDGIADLAGEIHRPVQFERTFRGDDVLERLSLNVLHHDEEDVLLLFSGGDGDDVGMADAGEEARLSQQFTEIQSLTMRDFDRDFLVDPGVLREVNGTESAASQWRDDLVLPECLTSE